MSDSRLITPDVSSPTTIEPILMTGTGPGGPRAPQSPTGPGTVESRPSRPASPGTPWSPLSPLIFIPSRPGGPGGPRGILQFKVKSFICSVKISPAQIKLGSDIFLIVMV